MDIINKKNISRYINFIHNKKHGFNAPKNLIDQWNKINKQDLPSQLNNLQSSWNIDRLELVKWNKEFDNKESIKKIFILLIVFGLFILIIGTFIYNTNAKNRSVVENELTENELLLKQNDSLMILARKLENEKKTLEIIEQNKRDSLLAIADKLAAAEEKENLELSQDYVQNNVQEVDNNNVSKIESLIEAEIDGNLYIIKSLFADKVVRYWDLKNISNDKIIERFQEVWNNVASDFSYRNVDVEKISFNTYKLTANYQLYSIKNKVYKLYYIENVYRFNSEGKIIEAYALRAQEI